MDSVHVCRQLLCRNIFHLPFMCRHCPGARRPLCNGARHSCNDELPFMGNGCRPDHCSTLSDHSLSAIVALLGRPLFVAIVSGVVGRCSRRGSAGQGHTPGESLLGGCFWAVSPQTPQTVQVRRLFGPQTAPQTDPRQTPDSTRDGPPGRRTPPLGYLGVCTVMPLCGPLPPVRRRSGGLCRAWSPGRHRGSEPLRVVGCPVRRVTLGLFRASVPGSRLPRVPGALALCGPWLDAGHHSGGRVRAGSGMAHTGNARVRGPGHPRGRAGAAPAKVRAGLNQHAAPTSSMMFFSGRVAGSSRL